MEEIVVAKNPIYFWDEVSSRNLLAWTDIECLEH